MRMAGHERPERYDATVIVHSGSSLYGRRRFIDNGNRGRFGTALHQLAAKYG